MKRIDFRRHLHSLKKKFRLTIFNESTLENLFSLRASLLDGVFMIASLGIVMFLLSWFLLVHTPLRSFLPQDLDPGMRKKLLQQALRVDSMANALELQSNYLKVVNAIVSGDVPVDSVQFKKGNAPMDSVAKKALKLMTASSDELDFRENFESSEKDNLSIFGEEKEKKELLMHAPLKGKIVSAFNPKLKHNGLDIQVSGIQPCVAVLAGTVIFAGYTADYDYVIHLQHSNDFVSVYKYNTEILKKTGDKVKSGEAIGMAGGNPGRHGLASLSFELWQKGVPLNPEEYIVF
jgi:murein DD-endopeptidase MepM/ murein hydrolase activator NlpD